MQSKNMNKHSEQSSYREKLIEHLFIGELLKLSWTNGDCQLEVGKPEVDNSGYDGKIKWQHHPDGLQITFPKEKPCDFAYCLKIHMPGK